MERVYLGVLRTRSLQSMAQQLEAPENDDVPEGRLGTNLGTPSFQPSPSSNSPKTPKLRYLAVTWTRMRGLRDISFSAVGMDQNME
jgi:hypothetical protein